MYSPIEIAIQIGIASAVILFVHRGLLPMVNGYLEPLFTHRLWRR